MSRMKYNTFHNFFSQLGKVLDASGKKHKERISDFSGRVPLSETAAFQGLQTKRRNFDQPDHVGSVIPEKYRDELQAEYRKLKTVLRIPKTGAHHVRDVLANILATVMKAEKDVVPSPPHEKKGPSKARLTVFILTGLVLTIGLFWVLADVWGASVLPFLSLLARGLLAFAVFVSCLLLISVACFCNEKDKALTFVPAPRTVRLLARTALILLLVLFGVSLASNFVFSAIPFRVLFFVRLFLWAAAGGLYVWSFPVCYNSASYPIPKRKRVISVFVKISLCVLLAGVMIAGAIFVSVQSEERTLSDNRSGVSVTLNDADGMNKLDRYDLSVNTIKKENDEYTVIGKILGDEATEFVAYDIELYKNESPLDWNGSATVKLPLPSAFAMYNEANLALYYVGNGTYRQLDRKIVNNEIVFETSHFSTYVVAVKPFTVTFHSDNGSTILSGKAMWGERIGKPADPSRTGYTFAGWTMQDGDAWDFSRSVTEDVTLTANWTANRYTVTFDPAGGTVQAESRRVVFGDNYTLAVPVRARYDFVGWFAEDGTSVANDGTWQIDRSLTLTAHWEKQKAKILEVTDATVDGHEVFLWVEPNTDSVALSDKVTCSDGSVWTLADADGQEIGTKVADGLVAGENRYAISVVFTDDPETEDRFELVVFRSSEVSVRYYDGDHLEKQETVLTGKEYVPDELTSFLGYDCYWALSDVRFEGGIIRGAIDLYAVKQIKDDISGFLFESTETECNVTGIKDEKATAVVVPDYVTGIAKGAFSDCTALESITIPFVGATKNGTDDTHFGYVFGAADHTSNATAVPPTLKTVVVTGGTSVGANAFSGCSDLTNVSIPDTVNSIGASAFSGCTELTAITLPFIGATKEGASNVHFGYVFGAAEHTSNPTAVPVSLKKVVITGGTSIGQNAFYDCYNLTTVDLLGEPTSIGQSAFKGCEALTGIAIPKSVATIGVSAFSGCTALASVTLQKGLTVIGDSAFKDCASLTELAIPKSVTSVGNAVLSGCANLRSITLPDDMTGIGNDAFYGCGNLTSLKIPVGVTSIGNRAFAYSGLTSVEVPSRVTSIGFEAFKGCERMVSISLPFVGATKDGTSNVHFGYVFGANTYDENSGFVPASLQSVTVAGGSKIGFSAFYKCASLSSVTIADGVTSIENHAFSGCSGLTSVALPDSVTSIGKSAFYGCASLSSITIPPRVTSIGESAFDYCRSLTSVEIPNSTLSIGDSAFDNCDSLETVIIGNGVTRIGRYAFSSCSKLTSVTFVNSSGWWLTSTSNYSGGSIISVTDPAKNASNIKSNNQWRSNYFYRK